MAKRKTTETSKPIESYEHSDKQRVNNPPVGLVTPDTDPDAETKKTYAYDPHLDPQLQWAGKAEHTSFEIPTVSLHVHERIDPRTIIEAVRKKVDSDQWAANRAEQMTLFEMAVENPPLREAVEFYKHPHGWSNRLVAGDSLLVMNSLLEKEGMAGKVQMVYIDPPYGIKYGSNFQPFVNKRDVKDGKDEDLTSEPETIRAFRDTWELGIHSYLTYLRDRLLVARELLVDSGSCFVQISDENVHHVRELMDEVFGVGNFMSLISFSKTSGLGGKYLDEVSDYLVWYAKQKDQVKYQQLYYEKQLGEEGATQYRFLMRLDGSYQELTRDAILDQTRTAKDGRVFAHGDLTSQTGNDSTIFPFTLAGATISAPKKGGWKTNAQGMERLIKAGRLILIGNTPRYIRYHNDFPIYPLNNRWTDTGISGFGEPKVYVVQTYAKAIQRCLLMTTDPGDLVFDPTCGSGTTAYVAEQWGRRWITCDTSRVALTLAKQRLMTAVFDYYELAHPDEGVGSGFVYKTVPHVTLKSIANNEPPGRETLYDQPQIDRKRTRVSGPFTVEAVPAPAVKSVDDLLGRSVGVPPAEMAGETPTLRSVGVSPAEMAGKMPTLRSVGVSPAEMAGKMPTLRSVGVPPAMEYGRDARAPLHGASASRSGETLRQSDWRDELLRAGIRGKGGQHIRFARLETLPGCRYLHADGQTKDDDGKRIVVSFGPEYAPLEQRQVEHAWEEARTLSPKPLLLVFAAFQFDPEAAKDIDELKPEKIGMQLLKVQMNADMLTDDLKKKRASNESFWLIGQPDVRLERIAKGEDKGKWRVSVEGFDYYNTKTGGIESGGADKIAVWLLDTDYDGRSLYARQVFFPQAGETEGWARLARNLKAEIDEELIESYRGTVSLPFAAGDHKRIAVKIVDDRGIESLKIMEVE